MAVHRSVARRHSVKYGYLVISLICQRPGILTFCRNVPLLIHAIGDRGTVFRSQSQLLPISIDFEAVIRSKRIDITRVVYANHGATISINRLGGRASETEVVRIDSYCSRTRGKARLCNGRSSQSALRHGTHIGVAIVVGVLGEVGHLVANFLCVPFSIYSNIAQKLYVGGSLLGAFGVKVPTVKGVAFFDGSRVGSHCCLGGVARVGVLGMVVGANPFPSLEFPLLISLAAPAAVGRGPPFPRPIARLSIVNVQRPGAR